MPATGKITQVIGSTFDAEFPEADLPKIYNALKVERSGTGASTHLTGEVASHLGGGKVRAVALGSTDGSMLGDGHVMSVVVGAPPVAASAAPPPRTKRPMAMAAIERRRADVCMAFVSADATVTLEG